MPVYEYWCEDHGLFEAMGSMNTYDQPAACPACSGQAARVMLTAPRLGASDRGVIQAHDTNAKAADSPKKLSQHGPGCGCCSGGRKKESKTLHHPNGAKSFPSKRPWMIAH